MYATYGATIPMLRAQGMGLRDVSALVKYLPERSPVWGELDPKLKWSQLEYLVADQIDQLMQLVWVTVSANADKNHRPPQPKPYPRPGKRQARLRGNALAAPTRAFDSAGEFEEWRASRLRSAS